MGCCGGCRLHEEYASSRHRGFRLVGNAVLKDPVNEILGNVQAAAVDQANFSGAELCAGLGTSVPEIVISDYRLARGETGFDAITAVRAAAGAKLPALILTGDTDPKLMRSMADRGIVVLHKPVDLETLQAYLELLTCEEDISNLADIVAPPAG